MPPTKLAPIETLPPELLQPIFVLSGYNISLPESSPHLALNLSSTYIYEIMCTHYLTQSLLDDRRQQSRAQTAIFKYKWMTWALFQSWVLKHFGLNGCLCGKTPDSGCFDPIWPPQFNDATTMLFSRSHLPAISYVKCRLPVKLLHGPWTPEKVQFLRFLLWTTSMTVDWANEATRKLVLQGKKEAIRDGNLEVVELFNHNRRLGKPPGLDMVKFAVLEGGCDRSIVYDTMATARTWGVRGHGWKCNLLDKWCEQQIKAANPKGKWLKIKLQELRQADATEGEELFGYMHPKTGDYEDMEDDKLVIRGTSRWNEVSK